MVTLLARNLLRRSGARAAAAGVAPQHLHLHGQVPATQGTQQLAVRALSQHHREPPAGPRNGGARGRKATAAVSTTATSSRRPTSPRRRSDGGGKMDLRFQRDSEMRAHRERFASQSAKAQRWMEMRAAAGDYRAIVRSVADCYAPLFQSHPALAGQSCALVPLLAAAPAGSADAASAITHDDDSDDLDSDDGSPNSDSDGTTTQFHKRRNAAPRYQEGRTKMMEQLALELLFKGAHYDLAVAVYDNRRSIVDAIATSGCARNDREQRMHQHYRSFFSLATGAYAALNDHAQVVNVYDAAVAAQLWPTVAMNVNYLRALTTLRRYDDAARAFTHITATDGHQNVFFYRCALFYAGVSGDTRVLNDARAVMRALRFELRPIDFAHCMRAFDAQYLAAASALSYADVLARRDSHDSGSANDGDDSASKDAARAVLALVDELVAATPSLTVTSELARVMYPRALAAAVLTDDCARVQAVVALRRTRGSAPLGEDALSSAVTGLLLAHAPRDAWRLVQDELEHASMRPRVLASVVGSLLSYLCARARIASASESSGSVGDDRDQHSTQLILAILDDLKRRNAAPGVVANAYVRDVIDTLCADTTATSTLADDQALVDVLVAHTAVFRVLDRAFWFAYFVECCLAHSRLDALKRVFQARSVADVPTLPLPLALACIEQFAERRDFDFVYRVSQAVNLQNSKCAASDRVAVCIAAMRACREVDWLGADEARAVYDAHLTHLDVRELPDDIQTLLATEP